MLEAAKAPETDNYRYWHPTHSSSRKARNP